MDALVKFFSSIGTDNIVKLIVTLIGGGGLTAWFHSIKIRIDPRIAILEEQSYNVDSILNLILLFGGLICVIIGFVVGPLLALGGHTWNGIFAMILGLIPGALAAWTEFTAVRISGYVQIKKDYYYIDQKINGRYLLSVVSGNLEDDVRSISKYVLAETVDEQSIIFLSRKGTHIRSSLEVLELLQKPTKDN